MIDFAKGPFFDAGDDGPFTDDMVRGLLKARQLQAEMIPHMERIAETLAAAGVASQIATGDSPNLAIDRWVEVIRQEAKRLLKDKLSEQSLQVHKSAHAGAKKLELK
jgi:hypothetical protein